jgi:nucleotide-binding universal stress UspA family protein
MNQILVAVDEHPHAEKVVDCAIELAKAARAKIILTYVITEKSFLRNTRTPTETPYQSTTTQMYSSAQ